MHRETFEHPAQRESSEPKTPQQLVSLDDFQAATTQRKHSSDSVYLGSMDLHLSFEDPHTGKPVSFDQNTSFHVNKEQAKELDFGNLKDLFASAMDPLQQTIDHMLSKHHSNDGDKPWPPTSHDNSGKVDKPSIPGTGDNPIKGHKPSKTGWPDGFLFGGNAHNSLDSIESAIGGRANLEMFPVRPGNQEQMNHVRENLKKGVTPEVSLNGEFFEKGSKGIARGDYDQQLTNMAREFSKMKGEDGKTGDILMRFGKEMNLQHDFVGSNEDFVKAYQHVADIFHKEAPNVRMVWCPTKRIDPSELGNQPDASKYWPGSKYVDVVGPDGYSGLHGRPQSFQEIFKPFVDFSNRIGKPFMVSETNVKTPMSDSQSAEWWRDAFKYVMNERKRGSNIIGVGVFARNQGEILSNAEKQMLRRTFIPAQGQ